MPCIEVEIKLGDFDSRDLIDELEERGYSVIEDARVENYISGDLISEEIDFILATFSTYAPGSMGYHVYEKMRKR